MAMDPLYFGRPSPCFPSKEIWKHSPHLPHISLTWSLFSHYKMDHLSSILIHHTILLIHFYFLLLLKKPQAIASFFTNPSKTSSKSNNNGSFLSFLQLFLALLFVTCLQWCHESRVFRETQKQNQIQTIIRSSSCSILLPSQFIPLPFVVFWYYMTTWCWTGRWLCLFNAIVKFSSI